jgi:hypothetical protein
MGLEPHLVEVVAHRVGRDRVSDDAGLSNLKGYRLGATKAEEVLTWCGQTVTAVLDVIEDTIPEWVRGGLTARLGIRQPLTTSAALERRGRVRLKAGDH